MTEQTGNKMADSREPKVGDVVYVRMTVSNIIQNRIVLSLPDRRTMYVEPADIVHIEPAPLKVGDRVRLKHGDMTGTVLATCDDDAWVDWGIGRSTCSLSDLTRIEASDGAGS